MAAKVPSVALKNGFSIPIVGLGTWKSGPGEVTAAVKEAIACGYRHLDCARVYGNENEVGEGIRAKIEDGTVKREDLFITTKLWITYGRKDLVVPTLKTQLKDLGLSYVDLYLVHWPVHLKEGDVMFPRDENDKIIFSPNSSYVDTWKGMEEAVRLGLTRSIGVSNFNRRQILNMMNVAEIPPVMNQIECHPYLSQKKLIELCKSKGIEITAYSPLGSPDRPSISDSHPVLLKDPVVVKLAEKYNKNVGQILIKYHTQNGTVVIPKSVNPARIRSNINVFDFELTPTEMDQLETLEKEFRFINFALIKDHPEYPFNDAY